MTDKIIDKVIMNETIRCVTFETIDMLIDYYEKSCKEERSDESYRYIVYYFPDKLLATLQSETNKLSKFDLSIINQINEMLNSNTAWNKNSVYTSILEFYKNRKK